VATISDGNTGAPASAGSTEAPASAGNTGAPASAGNTEASARAGNTSINDISHDETCLIDEDTFAGQDEIKDVCTLKVCSLLQISFYGIEFIFYSQY